MGNAWRDGSSIWPRLLAELSRDPELDLVGFLTGAAYARTLSDGEDTAGPFARRYRVKEELGRGGMGVVHRAFDDELQREVAVKFAGDPAAGARLDQLPTATVMRFLLEAHVTAQLEHPSIVPVHELGLTERDELYMTMKLVRGRTLREAVDAGEPTRALLEVLLRVADALAFAHERGVVHRDLKPTNVMVGAFGEVQVMDWGLARVGVGMGERSEDAPGVRSPHADVSALSAAGSPLGTPAYMAPEQARGRLEHADARTDVFGLGALLYYVLWGRAPHEGDSGTALERAAAGIVEFPSEGRDGAEVPHELRGVCERAMAEEPARRYASATALADDLRAYLEGTGGSGAWRDPLATKLTKWVRRHPRASLATAFAALLLAVGGYLGAQLVRAKDVNAKRVAIDRLEGARDLAARTWRADAARYAELSAGLSALLRETAFPGGLGADALERLAALRRDDPELCARARPAIADLARSMIQAGLRERAAEGDADGLAGTWPTVRELAVEAETDPLARRFARAVVDARVDELPGLVAELRERIEELGPEDVEQVGLYLRLAGADECLELANDCMERAAELRPRAPWPLFHLSVLAQREGRTADALRYAFAMYSAAPESPAALVRYASVLELSGAPEAAIPLFELWLEWHGEDQEVHHNLAIALAAAGRPCDALAHQRAAHALAPDDREVRGMLAMTMMRCGREADDLELIEGAAEIAERLVADEPDYHHGHRALGEALLSLGSVEAALGAIERSAELAPLDGDNLFRLGDLLYRSGRLEPAEEAFRRLLALAPGHLDATVNLGQLLLDRLDPEAGGIPDESARLAFASWAIQPRDTDCALNLSWILGYGGAPRLACAVLELRLGEDPQDVQLRLNYANALTHARRLARALRESALLVRDHPELEDARRIFCEAAIDLVQLAGRRACPF